MKCITILQLSQEDFSALQAKIEEKCSKAIFVQYYSHALILVLQQYVGNIKECSKSLNKLSGLSSFFSKSLKRKNVPNSFMGKNTTQIGSYKIKFFIMSSKFCEEKQNSFI